MAATANIVVEEVSADRIVTMQIGNRDIVITDDNTGVNVVVNNYTTDCRSEHFGAAHGWKSIEEAEAWARSVYEDVVVPQVEGQSPLEAARAKTQREFNRMMRIFDAIDDAIVEINAGLRKETLQ